MQPLVAARMARKRQRRALERVESDGEEGDGAVERRAEQDDPRPPLPTTSASPSHLDPEDHQHAGYTILCFFWLSILHVCLFCLIDDRVTNVLYLLMDSFDRMLVLNNNAMYQIAI